METWIKRDQRRRKFRHWRIIILAALLLIAAGISLNRFYPKVFNIHRITGISSDKNAFGKSGDVLALFSSILEDLGLDHLEISRQRVNHLGKSTAYTCYRAAWPKDFPFVWFTQNLQNRCSAFDDLGYEASELADENRLLIWLTDPLLADTLVELELIASSQAIPKVSSISFVFTDFADYNRQQALDLIWLDKPFGFTLKPDQVPDEMLAKALKSSQGQCFLELPPDTADWSVILNGHRLANRIPDNELSEDNLRTIFEVFPVLDAIYFQPNENPNRDLVKMIINMADNLRLTYLYSGETADYADSLAYLKGLKIKRIFGAGEFKILSGNELRESIVSRANNLTRFNKGLYFIPSRPDDMEIIKSLLPLFEKLNIKIAPPLRLAPLVDSL